VRADVVADDPVVPGQPLELAVPEPVVEIAAVDEHHRRAAARLLEVEPRTGHRDVALARRGRSLAGGGIEAGAGQQRGAREHSRKPHVHSLLFVFESGDAPPARR